MPNTIMTDAKVKMGEAIEALSRNLATVRAGRANASLVDHIQVEYYGAMTPLNQMASISVPEARLLVIKPYDKTIIDEIEKAILVSDIGITPSNDGEVIRLSVPALTEERRKELAKVVGGLLEDAKVAIRNVRRDANDAFKKLEKDGDITEDELHRYNDDVQKLTDDSIAEAERLAGEKEKEIMDV